MSRNRSFDSPYSIIRQAGIYAIHHIDRGVILDEIETFGSAECHIADYEDADALEAEEAAAEAERAATQPDLKLVPPQPIYRFERLHSTFEVRDGEDLTVAHFGYDCQSRHWWVVANTDRFTAVANLPAALDGHFYHRLPTLDGVHAMFGVPLPSVGEPVIRDIADPVTGTAAARAA